MATIDVESDISGEDWQKYVDELLAIHFAAQSIVYQRVPATNGDCGLEGYTYTGYGFQSYSDQNTISHEQRLKKQKSKITRDLSKLVSKRVFWEPIFTAVPLRYWCFIVPHFDDKKLIPHSEKKAEEIRAKSLPYIATDFRVVIQTHIDFPDARRLLDNPEITCRTVRGQLVTDSQVQALVDTKPTFIANLDRKIPLTLSGVSNDVILEAKKDYLERHLWCDNYLQDLFEKFPSLWERIDEFASATADAIQTEGRVSTEPAAERLLNVRRNFEEELKDVAKFATAAQRLRLSWGHVAKWLGVCNLNFRDPLNGQ